MRLVLRAAAFICAVAMTVPAGIASANPDELPVLPAALPSLMLSPEDVNPVMGVNMSIVGDWGTLVGTTVDRPDCGSAVIASVESYDVSEYTSARYRAFVDKPGWLNMVEQSMAIFPTWSDASNFISSEANRWRACQNQRVTMLIPQPNGSTLREWVQLRNVIQVQEVLVVGYSWPTDFGGVAYCQHAVAPLRNVAIDVRACAEHDGNRALDLIQTLLPRVAQA